MLNVRFPAIVPFLLFILMPLSLHAPPPHIVDPWPDPAHIEAIRATHVGFLSSDPFVLRDFGHAPGGAQLFLPEDASPHNKVPAIVLLHAPVGNANERAATYGPPLAMGVAVMVIETCASRPDLGTGFIAPVLNITESMFVADAYAGLRLAGCEERGVFGEGAQGRNRRR